MPFLAPIFLRKAKQYTTKYAGSGNAVYGSGARNKKAGGEAYKLSSVSSSQRKGGSSAFATVVNGQSTGSEENILKISQDMEPAAPENGTIMKSVTYSVRVD
jgi:hypothetical protein